MKENDIYNGDKNFLYPELIQMSSVCPTNKCKMKKLTNINKTDNAEGEELESFNYNNIVNISEINIYDLGLDLYSISKYIVNQEIV